MARVLVTGSTGHIGANVVRELLQAGHQPVAFVRETSSREPIEGLEAAIAVGDVLDAASLEKAARGTQVIIHCAANFSLWAKDPDTILKPAVEGTRNAFRAAAANGVRRIVLTSSAAAIGASPSPDRLMTEADWLDDAETPYYRAKLESERLAYELAKETGVEVVVLCPALVLGAHDYRITPSMRPILDIANGKGPTVEGGAAIITARNVARAHVAAMRRGESGERYVLGGDNCTLVEIGRLVSAYTGTQPKHLTLPRWAFVSIAAMMELGASLSGKPPAMTRAAVRDVLGKYAWYDCSKARAALGFVPESAEHVIGETIRWFLQRGWLSPKIAERTRERLTAADAPAHAA